MYLLYLDEAGDFNSWQNQNCAVLGGVAVPLEFHNIVDAPLFTESHYTRFMQLADWVAWRAIDDTPSSRAEPGRSGEPSRTPCSRCRRRTPRARDRSPAC